MIKKRNSIAGIKSCHGQLKGEGMTDEDTNERETPLWERVKNMQEGKDYKIKQLQQKVADLTELANNMANAAWEINKTCPVFTNSESICVALPLLNELFRARLDYDNHKSRGRVASLGPRQQEENP